MAFDEPDTHLDYKSQRAIFDVIRRFTDFPAIQVIVCTHSLNFIERVPINQIVYYSLNALTRQTRTEILAATDHETVDLFMYEISKNMGLKNSVMLHERCFLAVEGSTEVNALPVLFHKYFNMALQAAGICLVNGHNNYGARMLTKFLNANRRQVLFLVDTDSKSSNGKCYFTSAAFKADGIDESTQVHYVGIKEFEDAFDDEVWARVANLNYQKSSGGAWTAHEFNAIRSKPKFSEELVEILKRECGLAYEPSKTDLGYQLAQCVSKTEIPPAVVKCLEEAYRRANALP